jgi:ubiquitin-conjugating enzyme E2 G1
MAPPPTSGAAGLLARQLKQMQNDKDIPGISCGLVDDKNVFEWEVMLMISDDCKYYGGGLLLAGPYSHAQTSLS